MNFQRNQDELNHWRNDKYLLRSIEQEKSIEKQNVNIQDLQEGVYDPNILSSSVQVRACKSYVVKRTTGGLGMKIVNVTMHLRTSQRCIPVSEDALEEEELEKK